MEDQQIIGILGQGGLGAALLYLLWKVGSRIVAALDKVSDKLDEHTKVDLAHHGKVMEEIAELSGRIEGIAYERERTPVETPSLRPGSRTVAGTTYLQIKRPNEEK